MKASTEGKGKMVASRDYRGQIMKCTRGECGHVGKGDASPYSLVSCVKCSTNLVQYATMADIEEAEAMATRGEDGQHNG